LICHEKTRKEDADGSRIRPEFSLADRLLQAHEVSEIKSSEKEACIGEQPP
jgi:hypothetical protein